MKKKEVIIAVVITASVLLFFGFIVLALLGESDDAAVSLGGKRIGLIEVHGVIANPTDFIRQIKRFSKDSSIPVIVLDIDSPGGGVAASQEMYEEIGKAKEKGKKIVAAMRSVAASGGYYIACAADTIVANPGTITGSIGVIFEFPVVEGLLKKVGVRFEVVKSGAMKDVGSMWRDMTPPERKMVQDLINDTYDQFVEVVTRERGLNRNKVLQLADGRVFTGRIAKELKLVDELGNLEDALKIANAMGGMTGEPKVIKERPRRRTTIFDLLGKSAETLTALTDNQKFFPKLQYLYR
jgi:protease IV